MLLIPIGSMYAIYGNIYHQYTPNMLEYIPYLDPVGYQSCWLHPTTIVTPTAGAPHPIRCDRRPHPGQQFILTGCVARSSLEPHLLMSHFVRVWSIVTRKKIEQWSISDQSLFKLDDIRCDFSMFLGVTVVYQYIRHGNLMSYVLFPAILTRKRERPKWPQIFCGWILWFMVDITIVTLW